MYENQKGAKRELLWITRRQCSCRTPHPWTWKEEKQRKTLFDPILEQSLHLSPQTQVLHPSWWWCCCGHMGFESSFGNWGVWITNSWNGCDQGDLPNIFSPLCHQKLGIKITQLMCKTLCLYMWFIVLGMQISLSLSLSLCEFTGGKLDPWRSCCCVMTA